MTKKERKYLAREIVRSLDGFAKLERKATDEIGWIALRYSTTRDKAEKMIVAARALVASEATP